MGIFGKKRAIFPAHSAVKQRMAMSMNPNFFYGGGGSYRNGNAGGFPTFNKGDRVTCPDPYHSHHFDGEATVLQHKPGGVSVLSVDGRSYGRWYFIDDGGDLQLVLNKPVMAAKAVVSRKLDLAHLEALVIDVAVKDEISAVLKQHKNHKTLFEDWGLGDVIEYGKGMTFLFWGPPGTGKTWGAHCIAKALGTELLIISSAEIQSSEPGGANRAIQQAFAEAKSSGKVLFIDECDSLISSRADLGMILASEVNTLLTEIEKFEGVLVLATNRIEHMDEALERRISLIVEFPLPKYEERLAIWKRMLPEKLPLGTDVEIEALASDRLSGGQIKNVVLAAARLALSQEHDRVSKAHFDSAISRVLKSKDLLGSAPRALHGRRSDVGVGVGKDVDVDVDVDVDIVKVKEPAKAAV